MEKDKKYANTRAATPKSTDGRTWKGKPVRCIWWVNKSGASARRALVGTKFHMVDGSIPGPRPDWCFKLRTGNRPNVFHESHADQLKPGAPLPQNGEDMPARRSHQYATTPRIEVVHTHDTGAAGIRRFLVHWLQSGNREDTWVTQPELELDQPPLVTANSAVNCLPPSDSRLRLTTQGPPRD